MSQTPDALVATPSVGPGSTLRTFLVEDSAVIRENLIATLEELTPVQVVGSAEDEGAARRWLDDPAHECDLVIVDVVLRSGSGLGVLRAEARQGAARRFVVLTNYATADMRERCRSLGADRVFDKSNEIDALIQYCSRLADDEPADSGVGALP